MKEKVKQKKIVLKGTAKPSYNLMDALEHIYNVEYISFLLSIIESRKKAYKAVREFLQQNEFILAKFGHREEISFKKEIKAGEEVKYILTLTSSEDTLEVNCELRVKRNKKFALASTILLEIDPALAHTQFIPSTLPLHNVRKETRKITSQANCIGGVLSCKCIKGELEELRGRFLSLLLTGDEDYYSMVEKHHTAMIVTNVKVKYFKPLKPNESFVVSTKIPEKLLGKTTLRIAFFQKIVNKQNEICVESETEVIMVDSSEKKPKRTTFPLEL
ncbi:MAG: acyl-CoA thioesterase [Candidatus Peribacteria bacterium]|jgi:acyl-CoA thioesterase FadM|nr:acyl-CoA thioesterase [Candidatus Peribacteria bacterium]